MLHKGIDLRNADPGGIALDPQRRGRHRASEEARHLADEFTVLVPALQRAHAVAGVLGQSCQSDVVFDV